MNFLLLLLLLLFLELPNFAWSYWNELTLKLILPSAENSLLLYVFLPSIREGIVSTKFRVKVKVASGEVTTKEEILVEGDIVFSKDQLNRMDPSSITTKQCHTYNLVSSPRTINVIGYTGTGYGQN